MASFSRRTFLVRGGTGAAAVAFLAAIPAFPGRAWASVRPATVHNDGVAAAAGRAATGPMVVHIPDPRTGDVHVMFGTREVVRRDRALVARLVRAAG
jgi:hypothetical protein